MNDKFESLIERIPESGCWIWMGYVHRSGYGRYNSKTAHRLVYQDFYNIPLTSDQKVCHRCDIRCCVNPYHMFVGTQKDNIDDMDTKGRRGVTPGVKNGRVKLTEDQVKLIRQDSRKNRDIAKAFEISNQQVSNIKLGLSWSHI